MRRIPEIMRCRILLFMWSCGVLYIAKDPLAIRIHGRLSTDCGKCFEFQRTQGSEDPLQSSRNQLGTSVQASKHIPLFVLRLVYIL